MTAWYLRTHFRTTTDPGVLAMFMDSSRVGAFAVSKREIQARDPDALFRVLIATTMFQRRQDQQILRVLQGIRPEDANELTSTSMLLRFIDDSRCAHIKTNAALLEACDLTKRDGVGVCGHRPRAACHLKSHTVTLKRYGHFGKVPTSAALALRERGVVDLEQLRCAVLREHEEPLARARALERDLSAIWRVSEKISAMFLSALCNPDLNPDAPWSEGIDWTYFVVIDSNVDLFLKSIGYKGGSSYRDRRSFLQLLAAEIDLRAYRADLHSFNPRVVQQAFYLFMSRTNRRAIATDCAYAESACQTCPKDLSSRCSARSE